MRMTDEERNYYERTRKPIIPIPTTRRGKALFALALVAWFAILLLPCAFFALATFGEITLSHGAIPESASHPWLKVRLIMDADNRGLQFTRSAILPDGEEEVCVETHVSYLMWQTRQIGELGVIYCDCYARTSSEMPWQLETTVTGQC